MACLLNVFQTIGPVGVIFQDARNFFVYGVRKLLDERREVYGNGWDIVSLTSIFPTVNNILISDAAAIKEVTSDRFRYPKPLEIYEVLAGGFGMNILFSEGDVWKRYRKLASPAFADRNNNVVWETTMKLMDRYIDERGDSHAWDDFLDYTLEVTVAVLTVSAFGESIQISRDPPPGHTMTFPQALKMLSCNFGLLAAVPAWVPEPFVFESVKRARKAVREFTAYMTEMIENRKGEKKHDRIDLFSILLEAYESGETEFTKKELLSNMFIFLIAGHESTSHTLCYAFALLALYPEVQERMYEHCKSVWPKDHELTYHDINSFTYTNAVIFESLRMYPIVPSIPKLATEDFQLAIGGSADSDGKMMVFPIPKGSIVGIHISGLHYNPRYWDHPEEFRPERFLDPDWPRDAFLPFSSGARSCLGRKFAEVEATTILTRLVMHYKVSITEEPQFAHETFKQRKQRVLRSYQGMSLTPYRTPLTFIRR